MTENEKIIAFGICGENVEWTVTDQGVLTFSGAGPMTHDDWEKYKNQVSTVVIREGVESIVDRAFMSCKGLISITIPLSVTSIGNKAFMDCNGLTAVTIPSVKEMGLWAFTGCTGLNSVTLSSGVEEISVCAFAGCTGLTSITIPSTVNSVDSSAFSDCTRLTSITVDPNNPFYDSRENCNAIILTPEKTLICGCASTTIPFGVEIIDGLAFSGCNLTSITIPSSVKMIKTQAFGRCTGLTSITIPSSVTFIGFDAFEGCTNLNSIIFESCEVPEIFNLSIPEHTIVVVPDEAVDAYKTALRERNMENWVRPMSKHKE